MGGVFLTEGHRLQPRNKRKVKPYHPWSMGMHLRSGVVMPNSMLGDTVQTEHIPNTVGCYHTPPKGFDQ